MPAEKDVTVRFEDGMITVVCWLIDRYHYFIACTRLRFFLLFSSHHSSSPTWASLPCMFAWRNSAKEEVMTMTWSQLLGTGTEHLSRVARDDLVKCGDGLFISTIPCQHLLFLVSGVRDPGSITDQRESFCFLQGFLVLCSVCSSLLWLSWCKINRICLHVLI